MALSAQKAPHREARKAPPGKRHVAQSAMQHKAPRSTKRHVTQSAMQHKAPCSTKRRIVSMYKLQFNPCRSCMSTVACAGRRRWHGTRHTHAELRHKVLASCWRQAHADACHFCLTLCCVSCIVPLPWCLPGPRTSGIQMVLSPDRLGRSRRRWPQKPGGRE